MQDKKLIFQSNQSNNGHTAAPEEITASNELTGTHTHTHMNKVINT